MSKKEIKTDTHEIQNGGYSGLAGRCSTCSHWNRGEIDNWPEKNTPAKVGYCKQLDHNEVNYWDSIEVVNDKIVNDKIGCENLYTGENFGCTHHNVSLTADNKKCMGFRSSNLSHYIELT